jgi:DNA-binding transcriptional ArsR family regulator
MTDKSYDYCRAVSGSQRWPIVKLLYDSAKSLSVKAIVAGMSTDKSESRISHQLKILRDNGVVKYERKGRESIYTLVDRKRVGGLLTV